VSPFTSADVSHGQHKTPAAELFDRVDTDGSGLLSFNEFASWWSRKQLAIGRPLDRQLAAKVQQQWAQLDTDGSGDLDRGEFESVMTELATSEWKEAFDRAKNAVYFYNEQTKETRWHQPDAEAAVAAFMETNGLAASSITPPSLQSLGASPRRAHSAGMRQPAGVSPPQPAWTKQYSEQHSRHYWTSSEGKNSWVDPNAGARSQAPPALGTLRQAHHVGAGVRQRQPQRANTFDVERTGGGR